jgi:hypothetical protein
MLFLMGRGNRGSLRKQFISKKCEKKVAHILTLYIFNIWEFSSRTFSLGNVDYLGYHMLGKRRNRC